MAQYILTHSRYVIDDAMITKPYEEWGGLFRGGTFTAVCIAIFRDNPFRIVVRDNVVLLCMIGQVPLWVLSGVGPRRLKCQGCVEYTCCRRRR
jgi:hypothetical protein